MAEPDTRFMTPILAGVGALQQVVNDVDLDLAARGAARKRRPDNRRRAGAGAQGDAAAAPRSEGCSPTPTCWRASSVASTESCTGREAGDVGFAARTRSAFLASSTTTSTWRSDAGASRLREDLGPRRRDPRDAPLDFYARSSRARRGSRTGPSSSAVRGRRRRPARRAATPSSGSACVAAHRGFQLGLELLLLIPRIGSARASATSGRRRARGRVFPEKFSTPTRKVRRICTRALAPPPRPSATRS